MGEPSSLDIAALEQAIEHAMDTYSAILEGDNSNKARWKHGMALIRLHELVTRRKEKSDETKR